VCFFDHVLNMVLCVFSIVAVSRAVGVGTVRLSILEVCAGSEESCFGNECCPGFEGSDWKSFPCPNADPGWDACTTNNRDASRDDIDVADNVLASTNRDPHVTTVTREKFDLFKTGWSTFVQVPQHIEKNEDIQLLVNGHVQPYAGDKCAPGQLKEVTMIGSWLGNTTVFLRSGSLEGSSPFAVSINSSEFVNIEPSGSQFSSSPGCTLRAAVIDDEPGVWGPDVLFVASMGSMSVAVKQHTEGRGLSSSSTLDLIVAGLDDGDSVGGWLGVEGSMLAGSPPVGCPAPLHMAAGVASHASASERRAVFHSSR